MAWWRFKGGTFWQECNAAFYSDGRGWIEVPRNSGIEVSRDGEDGENPYIEILIGGWSENAFRYKVRTWDYPVPVAGNKVRWQVRHVDTGQPRVGHS